MRPHIKLLSTAVLALLAISSCTQEEITPQNSQEEKTPVNFTMGVNTLTRTTTTGLETVFDAGDQVGIFAAATGDNQNNVAYTRQDDGSWNGGIEIYDNQSYSYYAYYPYSSGVTSTTSTFSVAADQRTGYNDSDVLTARNTTAGTSTTVALNYDHAFALVEVTVQSANVTYENAVVTLKNVVNSAEINLTDGKVTPAATTGDVIMQQVSTSSIEGNNTNVYRAVVPAQSVSANNVILTITGTSSGDWQFAHSAAFNFNQGAIRRMTVTVGNEPTTTIQPITIEGDIAGWGEDQDDPIEGEGTEVVEPVTSLDLSSLLSTETVFTVTGTQGSVKLADAANYWFIRGTTVTTVSYNETEQAIEAVNSTGARGAWASDSFGYHCGTGVFNHTYYRLTFQVKSTITGNQVIAIGIRNSDDTKSFRIANLNNGLRNQSAQNITTADTWTNVEIVVDFTKANTATNLNDQTTFADTEASDLEGITIYFFNNLNQASNPQPFTTYFRNIQFEEYSDYVE